MRKRHVRLLSVCITALFCFYPCTGQQQKNTHTNYNKIYPVDSPVYQALSLLHTAAGTALPSTAGPWSAGELKMMCARIDRSSLSDAFKKTYDYVINEIEKDHENENGPPAFNWIVSAALETYTHANTSETFQEKENWIYNDEFQQPFLSAALEIHISPVFYLFSAVALQNLPQLETSFGSSVFSTNIPALPPATYKDIDLNFPNRAFVSFGAENWNLEIGRDKLSWGAGSTGNFLLGSHFKYHNTARFAAYTPGFKYSFVSSFFPHPQNYYKTTPGAMNSETHVAAPDTYSFSPSFEQTDTVSGISMFMAHRLEFRTKDDKLQFTVNEALMFMSEDNWLDLSILNPAYIYHNTYLRSNANSMMTLEADWTFMPGLNVYGQIALDELAFIGEPIPGEADGALPNAAGFMIGLKGAASYKGGIIYGSIEGVYTDPYLYLRDAGTNSSYTNQTQKSGQYGINWIGAIRQFSNVTSSRIYSEDFIGYQYGGDAAVLEAKAGWHLFGKLNIEAALFFMAHGTHDIWTCWTKFSNGDGVNDDGNDKIEGEDLPSYTPGLTTEHVSENHNDPNYADRDSLEYSLFAGASAVWTVRTGLDIYGQANLLHIINPGNISSNNSETDVQLVLGVKYTFF